MASASWTEARSRGQPEVRALMVRQPWAWAIIYSGKDVENRRWRTSYRGPLPLSSRAADASGLRVPPAAVTDKLTGLV